MGKTKPSSLVGELYQRERLLSYSIALLLRESEDKEPAAHTYLSCQNMEVWDGEIHPNHILKRSCKNEITGKIIFLSILTFKII